MYYKQEDNLSSDLILAIGISYMEIGQPYKAIYQFERIIVNGDISFSDTALWYKALALLRAEEYGSCNLILTQLSKNEDSDYIKESQVLLTKVNRLKK